MNRTRSHSLLKRIIVSVSLFTGLVIVGLIAWAVVVWCLAGQHDGVIMAARKGDLATVENLAGRDVYLNRGGFEEHTTPLGAATEAGQTKIAKFLICHRVDVNALDDGQHTALYRAHEYHRPEIAQMILEVGGHD